MRGWRTGWVTGLTALGLLVAPAALAAQSADDEAAVREAVLDYVDAIYEVEPERIERSVARDLDRWMIKNILWQSPPM